MSMPNPIPQKGDGKAKHRIEQKPRIEIIQIKGKNKIRDEGVTCNGF